MDLFRYELVMNPKIAHGYTVRVTFIQTFSALPGMVNRQGGLGTGIMTTVSRNGCLSMGGGEYIRE